ncbi:flagellar basal body rod protein FlgB [Geomesophilobacter sediminis]|uniref:Flagellar basal body rod protein FlgB n=1 Tax=Geomesophilobacter sediminis TaxID=2798584 RepID=A0A8J7JJZ9_9BACT|nr:flagellar basal body rod protein FlgB [Geomesophilobacter sediminis]MBJ6724740.1 flagellar basal body rod protein FlgB [Geomesophilobacter sediminis]
MALQIFGNTVELLGKTLDLRAKRQGLISSNLANVETPNFTPSDLSFEKELKNAVSKGSSARLDVTNPRHIPLKGGTQQLDRVQGDVLETPDKAEGPDGNSVAMETEMGRLAENQIMYNASIQLLNKKFDGIKLAIKGS